ncbi:MULTISPECIES: imidazole glycerol phosphate synthase subunit HisF [Aerococcus]|jgi:cyclase|uniref:Imidazole glycerol phosphate synthase subunit HisF n=3 Tax=Aerococcus urinaeequi TaxID=51665 RepID=A0A0U4PDH6_9LACT|nr:HisA/HisF-related TIM barrel protein [Aerococcus urinaeequi]QGS36550.1 imidazole glycerol phosphate synthase subunit HisF [Aerococcus viridans]ALZ88350.1 imidazole glycerol phosphate synthase cyclase subunit [Aerococcus urinaeequi]AMB97868.1 imidazole glycerol phosphate synthase cyclase subunit [Aerococcus urinaeequi]MCY7731843.1 imidazole glycerol phosphate synthase cyclase subunit [Aerococcus urinaeequi]MDT2761746.1 HisA/HisF-related TIM barrel protein [Aerococcus urinaeequi]
MKKIIPCLDTRDGKLVKGVHFVDVKELGDPVDFAKKYSDAGADELVILDITKTTDGHQLRTQMIADVANAIDIPLTVGGGIASVQDIQDALDAGASKVGINSAAVKNPDFINEAVAKFGSDAVTIAVDMAYDEAKGDYFVYTNAGQTQIDINALEWCKECEERGAGALLITSIDTDGAYTGFDIPFLKLASETVSIPIIASGGASGIQDFIDLFQQTNLEAGLAASIFHKGEVAIEDLKAALIAEGID